jgi:hypothetical protein
MAAGGYWGCPSYFLCAVALGKGPDTAPTRGRQMTVGPSESALFITIVESVLR